MSRASQQPRAVTIINNTLRRSFGVEIKKASPPPLPVPIGMVEEFTEESVLGWISARKSDYPIKIELLINGDMIHSTWANVKSSYSTTDETRSFYLGVRGIWDYCKTSDKLTIHASGTQLPINHTGTYKNPHNNGRETLEELKDLLSNGYVINRAGDIQLSKKLDIQWQKKVIKLYRSVAHALKKECDKTPFLIYGSLLGQVREGGFIGHDDDLDIAYISDHTDSQEAARELVDIARTLRNVGFDVDLRAEAIHIHDQSDPDLRIDLFHLFFNEKGYLAFPFGIAGTSNFKRDDWEGLTNSTFAGFNVKIPRNAEKLVEYIYGSSWRTPIAGFSWRHARIRQAKSGKVSRELRDKFDAEHPKKR